MLRLGTDELSAHGVGRLGQVAQLGAGLLGDPLAQGLQGGSLRVLRSGVAQQHSLVLARQQRGGDGLGGIGSGAVAGDVDAQLVGDRHGHVAQGLSPGARRHGDALSQGHQPVVVGAADGGHLGAALGGMAQARGEQRVILAQEGADHQGTVQRAQLGHRQAQPAGTSTGGEIGVAQAGVDVVGTQAANQLTQQVQLFDGAVLGGQRTDGGRTVLGLDALEAVGHVFQRRGPVDFTPLAALLDHGLGQAIVAAQGLVAEAVAVGDPAFVDRLVFERHHAHHLAVLDLHDQVGAGGIVGRDALAARQLPGAGAVAEGLAGERADRADVDHVARQLGVDRTTDEGLDLGMLAAVGHAQFHHAGDFLAEAHAAGALDAAAHFLHGDQRADVLGEHHALFFFVARLARAIAHGQVLQLALTALVTDRAVQRVVDQQELHDGLLGLDGFFALGANDHALRHGRGTGGHGLGSLLDVHQAHAAVGRHRQLLVITEVRDVGAVFFGGPDQHGAFLDLDLSAVDFDFNHSVTHLFLCAAGLPPGRPKEDQPPWGAAR